MSIEKNDPRLTEYALGEMDAEERARFEKELDANTRAEIESIRAMGADLESLLSESPIEGLDEPRKSAVALAAKAAPRGRWFARRRPLAAAAVLVLALGAALYHFATEERQVIEESARLDARMRADEAVKAWDAAYNAMKSSTGMRGPANAGGADNIPLPNAAPNQIRVALPGSGSEAGRRPDLEIHNQNFEPDPAFERRAELNRLRELVEADVAKIAASPTDAAVDVPSADPADPQAAAAAREKIENGIRSFELAVQQLHLLGREHDAEVRRLSLWLAEAERRRNPRAWREAEAVLKELIRRENPFARTQDRDESTFSVDVDTASYAQVRRSLLANQLPSPQLVRTEELVNYFRYDYAAPSQGPFATHVELADCPWNGKHKLARIAIKGREVVREKRPDSNLVFLIDVSGSMGDADKLDLLKKGLRMLVEQLDERDRVSIVTYASNAGCALEPTAGHKRDVIRAAIDALHAGGSTNGGAGIQLAYERARQSFRKDGVNRVLLCTDGDFNVGITDRNALLSLIAKEAESGVFLSVLGFGTGNYKDESMEEVSNRGNGNYAYIDSEREAKRVLVEQMSGTLVTIAKDVKIQVFFNPKRVAGWRLIGYENRALAARDFNDDKKDAGDIGAGHTVTAFYELIPVGADVPGTDPNPFVKKDPEPAKEPEVLASGEHADAWFQLRLRSKLPDGDKSSLIERFVEETGAGFDAASREFRFASGVAAFGMLLRGETGIDGINLAAVEEICGSALGEDTNGDRKEFLGMVRKARALRGE